jgi:hypothetical protein
MLMKTARTEEIESLEEMSDLVQVAIEGKKETIHQQAMQVKKEKMERRNKLKSQIQGTSRASTETTQSFLLIPDSPKAAQLRAEHLSQISQTSRRAEPKPPVSQPIFTEEDELDLSQQCYCGLQVVSYICRQKGLNYGRRFLRCPQTPGSHAQCHYFIWTEPPKNQQYEAMSHSATSPSKLGVGSGHQSDKKVKSSPKHKKKTSKKHSSSSSSSDVEIQGVQDRAASSTNRGPSCQHVWNRRGTNPHQEQKTCKLCGVRQVHVYKTGEIIHSRVDPSKIK